MVALIIWSLIFIVSITALVKAAGWIAVAAQKIIGGDSESDFAIAAVGAALPELAVATAAVLQNRPELAVAIVVGSSLANILLVVGVSALAAKNLAVKDDYLNNDLPFFVAAIAIFYFIALDGQIDFYEGLLMLGAFFVYAVCVLVGPRRGLTPRDVITPQAIRSNGAKLMEFVGTRIEKSFEAGLEKASFWKTLLMFAGGFLLLLVAAHFAVDSLTSVSDIFLISAAVMAMFVLSVAAALPEISRGLAVIRKKQHETALGNIFAATTVNLLLVAGMGAMLAPLPIGEETLSVGLPFMIAASGLLAVSVFGRKIIFGQGLMYLLLYFLFFAKLFNLF